METTKNNTLKSSVLKTLLYYDIFSHPLKGEEIFTFLPQNSVTRDEVNRFLSETSQAGSEYAEQNGYYYIKPNAEFVSQRIDKEEYSKGMWNTTRFVTHIIKRFPFVRCIMVTGTLSKNSSDKTSDLDFMIITAPGRLWVARTSLMLFKKIFLLNSKKYFCLNYFITEDNLGITERNIFTATEIATIKATYNEQLMAAFLEKNKWIKEFFPNYVLNDASLHKAGCPVSNRRSIVQRVWEIFFTGSFGDKLDEMMRQKTIKHWQRKFPELDEAERNTRLRSTPTVSKAHPGSVQKKILNLYEEKLSQFNVK